MDFAPPKETKETFGCEPPSGLGEHPVAGEGQGVGVI